MILTRTAVWFVALAIAGCGQQQSSQEQDNLQIVQRLHSEVWSRGNIDVLDEIIGDNYIKHWAAFEPIVGRDQLKQAISGWRVSFPDWNEEIEAIEASGNMVFARWTQTGTFTKDYGSMRANGKTVTAAAMGWIRFENGQIIEEWTILDNWGTQTQLESWYPEEWLKPGWE